PPPPTTRVRLVGLLPFSSATGLLPCGSRTPTTQITTPIVTSTKERIRVPYRLMPSGPMASPATAEPRVGNPPVKANQNQPATEPRIRSGLAICAHTRNENANSG